MDKGTTSSLHPHQLHLPTLYFVLFFYGVKPLSFAPYLEVFTQTFPTFRTKVPGHAWSRVVCAQTRHEDGLFPAINID